eukprot:CAMPEP_0117734044 /NCGR_PEP_ID=MMETSP0947-20121206/434_1 /TAXON_ID=44440 /ORGANISM="Chattonella subsalsa, Strain CCMP2191" /LENGTH=33 /DNA_ID= /DNA_START= /DNA_END= /DNA_ORIENTATION=
MVLPPSMGDFNLIRTNMNMDKDKDKGMNKEWNE